MTSAQYFRGAWLLPDGRPTAPLPDDVADRLVARGRAIEVEAPAQVAAVAAEAAALVADHAATARKPRNRGAKAVTEAPAADPLAAVESTPAGDPAGAADDAGGLPDLEAIAEPDDAGADE